MAIRFTDPVPSILEEVKARTGKGIEFIEKDNLSTYAALKMARISMPSHLIFYKKEHNELINHLIAHECGHIFRMYSSSEDKRLIPYSTQQIKLRALSEIEDEIAALSSVLSFDQLSQIINMWYSGYRSSGHQYATRHNDREVDL